MMILEPNSKLSRMRPDIWRNGLSLASALTGYRYSPKEPSADGTIYACGYGPGIDRGWIDPEYWENYLRHRPKSHEGISRQERIREIDRSIQEQEDQIAEIDKLEEDLKSKRASKREEIERLKQERTSLLASSMTVYVPEGGLEWLLHEVGHWLAASAEERMLPNYGFVTDIIEDQQEAAHQAYIFSRAAQVEWAAWAFEQIIMEPFGNARLLAAPSCRDGIAFARNVPIPETSLHYIERQIIQNQVDIEEWRVIYREWFKWGSDLGDLAPWKSAN